MNPFVRQAANRLFEIAVGLAAGCLALRIARLVESCIPWALVRFGGAAAMRGSFGEGIALPPDSPWAFHALHAFGEALLPAAAVVSATWLVPRLPRAAAPAAAFAAFWFAASATRELAIYARFGRGSVQTLVNAAGTALGRLRSAAPGWRCPARRRSPLFAAPRRSRRAALPADGVPHALRNPLSRFARGARRRPFAPAARHRAFAAYSGSGRRIGGLEVETAGCRGRQNRLRRSGRSRRCRVLRAGHARSDRCSAGGRPLGRSEVR